MNVEVLRQIVAQRPGQEHFRLTPVKVTGKKGIFRWFDPTDPTTLFYLKVYANDVDEVGEPYSDKHAREILAAGLVRTGSGILTPVSEDLGVFDGQAVLLQSSVAGIALDKLRRNVGDCSKDRLCFASFQAGSGLAELHQSHPVNNFGDILPDKETFATWSQCFEALVEKYLIAAIGKGVFNYRQSKYFEHQLASLRHDSSEKPMLCHGDFSPKNVIMNPDTLNVAGVIDFDNARNWASVWDLTKVRAEFRLFGMEPIMIADFFRGYSERMGGSSVQLIARTDQYQVFESLLYWVWGWNDPSLRPDIQLDVAATTTQKRLI